MKCENCENHVIDFFPWLDKKIVFCSKECQQSYVMQETIKKMSESMEKLEQKVKNASTRGF